MNDILSIDSSVYDETFYKVIWPKLNQLDWLLELVFSNKIDIEPICSCLARKIRGSWVTTFPKQST